MEMGTREREPFQGSRCEEFAERTLRRSFVTDGRSLVALPSVWARTRDTDRRVARVEGTNDLIGSIGCEFNCQ